MLLRTYEALYIVSPEVGDDDIQTIAKKVEALVADHGGTIVRSEIWGKRKLAYTVKKYTEGSYVLLRYTAQPDFTGRLENFFKLDESIIRYLVKYMDAHMLKIEAEQLRMKREEVRPGAARGRDDDSGSDDSRDRESRSDYRRERPHARPDHRRERRDADAGDDADPVDKAVPAAVTAEAESESEDTLSNGKAGTA